MPSDIASTNSTALAEAQQQSASALSWAEVSYITTTEPGCWAFRARSSTVVVESPANGRIRVEDQDALPPGAGILAVRR